MSKSYLKKSYFTLKSNNLFTFKVKTPKYASDKSFKNQLEIWFIKDDQKGKDVYSLISF